MVECFFCGFGIDNTAVAVRFAVTDMFYDVPYSVQAEDEACVMQFGVHSQYNWAAYK